MTLNEPAIKLRGHTLLCLQGFRGEGYSAAFVENLGTIHADLARDPRRLVEVIDRPDAVCGACPHHAHSGCSLKGDSFETEMRAQDQVVLTRLGLESGMRLRWEEILERIRHRVRGSDLVGICGQCRWLPLGYCAEGIESLRTGSTSSMVSTHEPPEGWIPSSSLKRPPTSKA
ncbi:MAG TPA: DUF1284 domain-containing protein [Nitrospiraceae bacterium]|jgi:hypothetical protein|nr:DUF1284 domain-containing protein [Nitrospiraceae bacterium]